MALRTLALDAISVRYFPLRIFLVPTLGPNIWMFQFVVVVAEDVL
jgi:hypothetical protein